MDSRLRGYRILSQVSASTDGVTYRAERDADGQQFEYRVMTHATHHPERERSLGKRLKLASLLDQPTITKVLKVWQTSPVAALVEVAAETSLAEELESLTLAQRVDVSHQVADALAAAHRLGLSHGNLTANTVRYGDDHTARIDFAAGDLQAEAATSVDAASPPALATDVMQLAELLRRLLLPQDATSAPPTPSEFEELRAALGPTDDATIERLIQWIQSAYDDATSTLPVHEVAADLRQLATSMRAADGIPQEENTDVVDQTLVFDGDVPPAKVRSTDVPEQLGRFRLIEKIGSGGMGSVYRGEDLSDGSAVAVKVLLPSLVGDRSARTRFMKEARLLGAVNNARVVRLLEANEDHGMCYIAMEYVDGTDLKDFLVWSGPLEERTALSIVADIARGLIGAHDVGIVHRDIKPANVLLADHNPDGDVGDSLEDLQIKLSDFGLARQIHQSESLDLTRAGSVIGTPTYMAPEQCGATGHVSPATDVYSLGITLYEMLAGRPPFVGDALEVAAQHRNEPLPKLSRERPEINEAVERLIERATAKTPEDRFVDAVHLLAGIESILRGETTGIDLHPVLPEHNQKQLFRADFRWDLGAKPHELWPYVSNTERINCAVGVPSVEYETEKDPQLGVRKFGTFRMAGMEIRWEEHPFEWIEGQRLGVLRTFTSGPFHWFLSIVETLPNPNGGTLLKHTVRISPRGLMGRMVAHLEVNVKGKPALDRVYGRIDKVVSGRVTATQGSDPYEKPHQLKSNAQSRLDRCVQSTTASGVDNATMEQLEAYIATAPAQELARLRPKPLAQQLGVSLESLVTACLYAVRAGALELHWDILCPTCRVSSNIKDTLQDIDSHEHCEFCNIDFDVDFGNSIEMTFRVHPDIRAVDTGTYCIGGPEHAPHVVAQVRLQSGERIELNTQLSEGRYLLRGPQLPYSVRLLVRREQSTSRAEIVLSEKSGQTDHDVAVRIGGQVIAIVNEHDRPVLVRIERTVFPNDVLTAAEASRYAVFRDLFPNESLREGQLMSLATATFLVAQLPNLHLLCRDLGDADAYDIVAAVRNAMTTVIERHEGAVIRHADAIAATFERPADAISAVLNLQQALSNCMMADRLQPKIAIHSGEALVTSTDSRIDFFGHTLQVASVLAASANSGDVLVTETISGDPEADRRLREAHWSGELLTVEGLESYPIQRIRPRS